MKTAVLFLIFNRLDTTIRVFEAIRQVKPPRLYVAADGPRKDKIGEKEKCEEVRSIIKKVDWDCEVKTLFRDENLGCGKAVSQAITWFFEQEEEGIILEDDVLPHPDFFPYCEELLEYYRNVEQVGFISGRNQLFGESVSEDSYTFISINHVWGWASWRRTWDKYNYELNDSTLNQFKKCLVYYYQKACERYYWRWIYCLMKRHIIDTWDYQLGISLMLNNSLSIIPTTNLIKNIGFGEGATHTINTNKQEDYVTFASIMPLKHPEKIEQNRLAEQIEIQKEKRIMPLWKYIYMRIWLYIVDLRSIYKK